MFHRSYRHNHLRRHTAYSGICIVRYGTKIHLPYMPLFNQQQNHSVHSFQVDNVLIKQLRIDFISGIGIIDMVYYLMLVKLRKL